MTYNVWRGTLNSTTPTYTDNIILVALSRLLSCLQRGLLQLAVCVTLQRGLQLLIL